MPRLSRNLVDNGYYHIVTRGLDRRRLFRYKQDYELFLNTTAKYLKQYKIDILHYCLMPNHLHFSETVQYRCPFIQNGPIILETFPGFSPPEGIFSVR